MTPAPATDVVLDVTHLAVGYGRTAVVFDASLQVRRGAIAVIVGPNGSGKSTLLKGVAGVLPPSAGTVRLQTDAGEVETTGSAPDRMARLGVAYVPQLANVFPSLSVFENLIVGLRKRAVLDRVDVVYTLFPDLRPAAKRPAHTLSGGQRMMLALGRALMTDPAVVIVDEPCAGLSPKYRDLVWDQLVQLRSSGVGLLVVEQNTRAALETGDYGYVLVAGRVRREGAASSLLSDGELIDLYIGRSA